MFMKKLILILSTFIFLFSIPIYAGDFITFLDGKTMEVKIKRIKNCEIVIKFKKQKYFIPADSIFTIEFENPDNKIYQEYLKLSSSDKCMRGQLDAAAYHGKGGGNFILGVLFGPFAVIGCAVGKSGPSRGANTFIMSENRELFNDAIYLTCYQKQARRKAITNAAIGWGAWILFVLLI